jgi:DNA repair exonuclease SbcCD ATPase subunit
MKTLAQYKDILYRASAKADLLGNSITANTAGKASAEARAVAVEEVLSFCQLVAKETQEQVKFQLEDIVNLALNSVYSDKYRFEAIIEPKRNGTEARLVLFNSNGNELDPIESTGGGVCDILSFALRIALLVISKNDRVLIMDEPFKFISKDVKESAIEIIKRISSDLGVQIICVTHDDELIECADRVFVASQHGGVSQVYCRGSV